jgi:hypothetical protein
MVFRLALGNDSRRRLDRLRGRTQCIDADLGAVELAPGASLDDCRYIDSGHAEQSDQLVTRLPGRMQAADLPGYLSSQSHPSVVLAHVRPLIGRLIPTSRAGQGLAVA